MSAILESEAIFQERAQTFGLTDKTNAMSALGWKTFGHFAFAVGMGPGVTDAAMVEQDLIEPVLGPRPAEIPAIGEQQLVPLDPEVLRKWLAQRSALKRLYWEAGAHAAADLERRVQARPEDDQKPMVIPSTERNARLDIIKTELGTGMKVEGPMLPSNRLVDAYDDMRLKGCLKYLPWSKITRRDQEMMDIVEDPFFKVSPQTGTMTWIPQVKEQPADVSDMLKVKDMLHRRGIALQMGKLCTYVEHRKLVDWYFELLDAVPPPKHKRVSLWQIMRCDEAIWLRFQEQTMAGLPIGADGSFPLSTILVSTMNEKRIGQFVDHLQGTEDGPQRQNHGETPTQGKRKADKQANNNQRNDNFSQRNNQNKPKNQQSSSSKGGKKGNGKAKKKGDNKFNARLPQHAIGKGWSGFLNGHRICYGYNLPGGCPNKTNDMGDCPKGRHNCAICDGNHVAGGVGCTKK
jgi:hypothetical protein